MYLNPCSGDAPSCGSFGELGSLGAARPDDVLVLAPVLARLGDLAGAEASLAGDVSPAAARVRGEVALIFRQFSAAC